MKNHPESRSKPSAAAKKSTYSARPKPQNANSSTRKDTGAKADSAGLPYKKKPRTGKPAEAAGTSSKPQPARLHKVMAAAGLGSRRALEQEISAGAIKLNGNTATLGQSLKVGDHLQWGEREWRVTGGQAQHRTLIYNKPEGEITSRSDPEGRPTVFQHLPILKDTRWIAIGRLDINTTGLLLLTTDGELANAMMHPSHNVDREYVCRVRGLVTDEQLELLRTGVMLDDGPAHFSDVQRMGGPGSQHATIASANQWFQLTLLEGRNREVRRLWEALDHMVSRLKRVRYGAAMLPKGLKVGRWHEVSARDHQVLREDVGLANASAELGLQLVRQAASADGPKATRRQQPGKLSRAARKESRFTARGPEIPGEQTPGDGSAGKGRGRAGGRSSNKLTQRSSDSPWKNATERKSDPGRRKPGSPAGQGRRPHPKSRRGER